MKFSSREDIEVPIAFVFAEICNFPKFESQAVAKGAQVKRLDHDDYKVGSAWDTSFKYRGRTRSLQLSIAKLDTPETLCMKHESSGIYGDTIIELVALSTNRTRIIASVELRPKTMPARILIQSLKLAKSNLTNRFKSRLSDFGNQVFANYSKF